LFLNLLHVLVQAQQQALHIQNHAGKLPLQSALKKLARHKVVQLLLVENNNSNNTTNDETTSGATKDNNKVGEQEYPAVMQNSTGADCHLISDIIISPLCMKWSRPRLSTVVTKVNYF
jgi:hypothetical protein